MHHHARLTRIGTIALTAVALVGCAQTMAQTAVATPVDAVTSKGDQPAPDGKRWQYGSGEAAGATIQAWRALADYALARAAEAPEHSVVMGLPDSTGGITTGSVPCTAADGTRKPPAIIIDADDTAIQNQGFAYWQAMNDGAYDVNVWTDYMATGAQQITPVPGAVTGIRRLREGGITVIFNSNRDNIYVGGTIAMIEAAGLGSPIHGQDLFLRGDDDMGSRKDGRCAHVAAKYCVLALAGDNLGDFADIFNFSDLPVLERRQLAARGALAQLWGNGWFMMANASYGAWEKGTIHEIFAPESRWQPSSSSSQAGKGE